MGRLCACALLVALASVRVAYAETDIEQADKLFAEGLALRDTNLQQSCDKFKQSLDKNPQAIGTLMNVALCDEKFGRIASAVQRFEEAVARAKEGNLPEYQTEAQTHIDALKPELPYVTIKFLGERPAGTRVLLGDIVVSSANIEKGDKVAVDPGELVVVVSAPGRLAYETKFLINKKEVKPIEVPELKKGVTVKSSRRTVGIITTISGGVLLGAGVVLGVVANGNYDDQFGPGKCNDMNKCPAENQTETERARTIGNVGTVVGAVGIAAIGVGAVLWFTAPKEPSERRLSVVPQLTPDSAGLTAIGRF